MKLQTAMLVGKPQKGRIAKVFASRQLAICIAILILVRVAVFIGTIWYPLPNEIGLPVSPLHYQTGIDFAYYESSRQAIFEAEPSRLLEGLASSVYNTSSQLMVVTRPILPIILQITDYAPENTFPLAFLYLLLSIVWGIVWMTWLHNQSLSLKWIYIFSLLPVPIWFGLNISPDLLFSLIVCGFLLSFMNGRYRLATGFVLLGLLTRPNGFSLLLFGAAYFTLIGGRLSARARTVVVIVSVAIGIGSLPFLWKNLFYFMAENGQMLFLGYSQIDYLTGIYPALPEWLGLPLSWFSLLGLKMLYFVGLRPSFGDTALFFILMRAVGGLILLPGLVRVFVSGPNWLRLFLLCFLFPIFLGLAQERYMLPILPILYYYGALSLQDFWYFLRNWLKRSLPPTHGR